jgi:hypothetical protein
MFRPSQVSQALITEFLYADCAVFSPEREVIGIQSIAYKILKRTKKCIFLATEAYKEGVAPSGRYQVLPRKILELTGCVYGGSLTWYYAEPVEVRAQQLEKDVQIACNPGSFEEEMAAGERIARALGLEKLVRGSFKVAIALARAAERLGRTHGNGTSIAVGSRVNHQGDTDQLD